MKKILFTILMIAASIGLQAQAVRKSFEDVESSVSALKNALRGRRQPKEFFGALIFHITDSNGHNRLLTDRFEGVQQFVSDINLQAEFEKFKKDVVPSAEQLPIFIERIGKDKKVKLKDSFDEFTYEGNASPALGDAAIESIEAVFTLIFDDGSQQEGLRDVIWQAQPTKGSLPFTTKKFSYNHRGYRRRPGMS